MRETSNANTHKAWVTGVSNVDIYIKVYSLSESAFSQLNKGSSGSTKTSYHFTL